MDQTIKNLKREIRGEMKDIASDYRVGSWDYQRVERMSPDEAFNRGYYRALHGILKALKVLKIKFSK